MSTCVQSVMASVESHLPSKPSCQDLICFDTFGDSRWKITGLTVPVGETSQQHEFGRSVTSLKGEKVSDSNNPAVGMSSPGFE